MSEMRKILCGFFALGLVLSAPNGYAASVSETDGSIFSGGSCPNCTAQRKSDKQVRIVDGTKERTCSNCNFKTENYVYAQPRYKDTNRNCCDLAPFALVHVDFKLSDNNGYNPYSAHVGNYRFRIFGCRRATKKALLNHGRVLQKEMAFTDVFKKAADKCYKVMEIPNVCLADPTVVLPEYVLTAEINDFFMNVCDEYDWEQAKKANKRDGTAEMTVTWRLMNLSQNKVYWKGVTSGYAELEDGIYEGEVKLAEDAFADAAARLSSLPGFEAQLKNRVSPEEMAKERAAMVAYDAQFYPEKCPAPKATPCGRPNCPMAQPVAAQPMMMPVMMQPLMMAQPMCPCAVQPQPCICTQPVCSCPVAKCPCAAQMPVQGEPKVEEFVDVKTKKKIIEQKIITKTRVETPAPVCQQVCQPVCPQPTCQVQCTKTCQPSKCKRICTEVCDGTTGKCTKTCREECGEPVQPKVEVLKYVPAVEQPVEQKGEVEVINTVVQPQIEETGGVEDTHRVYENCVDENGNVITDGSCVTDTWVDLGSSVDNKLCIVDRPPYSELSPENMLLIRGSIVDVTNALGKQGTGLIISDSFILTSADMVNKLQNTYDIKTIRGDVLKAKAVRFNPGKNIALLHLDTPTTYTPLSLNTSLPAIDQEGFIALGRENAQNYMNDNGKIYGYRHTDATGTEIIVDTLVNKVSPGSVLIDKWGTVNGVSNSAQQTQDGMDLFLPTDTALKSVGLTICEKIYKPVTEQIKQETKAPEAMPAPKRK